MSSLSSPSSPSALSTLYPKTKMTTLKLPPLPFNNGRPADSTHVFNTTRNLFKLILGSLTFSPTFRLVTLMLDNSPKPLVNFPLSIILVLLLPITSPNYTVVSLILVPPIMPQITVLISKRSTREVFLKTLSQLLTTLASRTAHHLLRLSLTITTTFSFPFTLNAVDLNDYKQTLS